MSDPLGPADESPLVQIGRCKHEQTEPHECPYAVEINDDHEPCTCCDSCAGECADDI